ncbi:hypothetical protein [Ruegeria sp. HKCCA4633]|uniref:hypothetical protein n=1 Tax=Ruegeria sp. HKCCA4633 TaxID=2682983 RepID=UPI0014882028|nr:hypothetical protein [Ruegeria sp. HKCCA4633]
MSRFEPFRVLRVRSIRLRLNWADFKARLKAKSVEDGMILTEAQVQALEKNKLDDNACR